MCNKIVDIRYLAGLFEGEGCAYISQIEGAAKIGALTVNMTDAKPVEAFHDYFGVGEVHYRDSKRENHNPSYTWHVLGKDAGRVAERLLPFILSERKRGALTCVIEIAKTLVYHRHNPIPPHIQYLRNRLHDKCRMCNARGTDRQLFDLDAIRKYKINVVDEKQLMLFN